jgi:hypothetical protein
MIEAAVVFYRLGRADAFCMSYSVPGQPTSIPMNGADLWVVVGAIFPIPLFPTHFPVLLPRLNMPSYQAVLDDMTRAEEHLNISLEQSHAEMDNETFEEYRARTARERADEASDPRTLLREVDRAKMA